MKREEDSLTVAGQRRFERTSQLSRPVRGPENDRVNVCVLLVRWLQRAGRGPPCDFSADSGGISGIGANARLFP